MEGTWLVDVFERLKAGGTPRTAWEIAYASLVAVGRGALRDEEDLSALGLSVIELADAVAAAITRREGIEDPHTTLSDAAVDRIHTGGNASTQELRKTVGKLRLAEIERRASILIKTIVPHVDAMEAVRAIDGKVRRDKSRGVTKTLDQLAGEVAELALAALDRESGLIAEPTPRPDTVSPMEARAGTAASKAFYQAIGGVIDKESLVGIVAGVKGGLGALEMKVRHPRALRSQLATSKLLGHAGEQRMAADVLSRQQYPFGLRDQESRAYLAAALHLLGAQAGSKNIARAAMVLSSNGESAEAAARKAILDAIASDAKQRSEANHEYQPSPNRFDVLRALAIGQMLASKEDIATILCTSGRSNIAASKNLLLQAFPLPEEADTPWTSAVWRSAGESIQGMLNFEHKVHSTLPAFSAREFEDTAVRVILLGLKDFINVLLRAEGKRAGYPNQRTAYEHRSVHALSNTLTTRVVGRDYKRIFAKLRMGIARGSRPEFGNTEATRPPGSSSANLRAKTPDEEISDSLVFLARPELLSLLMEVASLTAPQEELSPAARRLLIPDPIKGHDPAEAARARDAATVCIQFVHWSRNVEDLDLTLEKAFAEFYRDLLDLGQPPGFNVLDVAELLNDSLALLPDLGEGETA